MKRLALLLMLLPAQVQAQAASFEDFFGPFRAAVLAGDAKAIRAHTRLPFLFQGRMLDASGFEAAVPALFDPPTQACFRKPELVDYGGSRQIFCQGSIYIFADDGGWKFIEIGVDELSAPPGFPRLGPSPAQAELVEAHDACTPGLSHCAFTSGASTSSA